MRSMRPIRSNGSSTMKSIAYGHFIVSKKQPLQHKYHQSRDANLQHFVIAEVVVNKRSAQVRSIDAPSVVALYKESSPNEITPARAPRSRNKIHPISADCLISFRKPY